ncbi:MAG: hypothetical protein UT57_C0016G0006 [Microgenomates group bacterium GW2011_GWC1_39_7]|nr:MAG: hypothetical protein UT57_C0016G0006 [Microgenomates group bacterium GW2011_GWC1_39_7]
MGKESGCKNSFSRKSVRFYFKCVKIDESLQILADFF